MERVSRRGFITSAGAGVVGAAALRGSAAAGPAAAPLLPGTEPVRILLKVNGRRRRLSVEPRTTLLEALRDHLGLTGTKPGCERGECGACTVLIDEQPRNSCLTLAVEAEGHEITTVEGLLRGEELGEVQKAFVAEDAFQCGFCTSGQVMAVEGLLRGKPDPSLDEIREGVSGNLCRCGAYAHIFRAARRAAAARRQAGGAA
ncbi:MAG TPA: (2Fe-2S)-binding protein [Vicinamibacteria bacterium]|nr:(2Fe-2S)-binding protein [Vicinamibacteria bacterium]